MAIEFKVEDGTGVAGANSYLSPETLDDLFTALTGSIPAAWSSKGDDQQKAICRFVSRWLDNRMRGRLPGEVSTLERDRLLFPLTNAYDQEGRLIEGVPHEILELFVDLVPLHIAKPLENAPARGGAIESVEAGSIKIKWRDDAPADRDFCFVEERLSSLLAGGYSSSAVELTKDF